MSEAASERVRRLCLALPEAFEQQAWGHPTFRVRKRIFAIYSDRMEPDGPPRPAIRCNAPLGVQGHLVGSEPEKYYVPAYVGGKGWIGVFVDACTDEELRELLIQSYCMIAPKHLQALVSA